MSRGRIGQGLVVVAVFVLATLTLCVPVGILGASNLVWGEDHQSGRVPIPGTKMVRLSAGTLDASAAIEILGAGNATAALPLPPNLSMTVVRTATGAPAVVTRAVGASRNANDARANTQRRVWTVRVPSDGNYTVTTLGDFVGVGTDPELWLGHGPPLPGTLVPVVAAVLALLGGVLWWLIARRRPATAG